MGPVRLLRPPLSSSSACASSSGSPSSSSSSLSAAGFRLRRLGGKGSSLSALRAAWAGNVHTIRQASQHHTGPGWVLLSVVA